MGFSMLKYSE